MRKIDWDKAPEGATHYQPEGKYLAAWIKIEGNFLKAILDDGEDDEWDSAGLLSDKKHLLIPRPSPSQAWSGEGLPPVGGECEFKSPSIGGWSKARIVFVSGWTIVLYVFFEHDEHCYSVSAFEKGNLKFRPIRTPEQIAADEREAAIKEMLEDAGRPDTAKTRDQAQLLYDAGWRKQPKP